MFIQAFIEGSLLQKTALFVAWKIWPGMINRFWKKQFYQICIARGLLVFLITQYYNEFVPSSLDIYGVPQFEATTVASFNLSDRFVYLLKTLQKYKKETLHRHYFVRRHYSKREISWFVKKH